MMGLANKFASPHNGIRWSSLLQLAAVLRAVLLLYGEWQDANFALKYTDIDYVVFTDAAAFMHAGETPFNRATYRYTPVLAWMLQPNIWLHRAFGKVLFVLGDLVVGWIIYKAGCDRGLRDGQAAAYAAAWLLNPISINVSTRGNAEAVLSALIVGWMFLLLQRRTVAAAVLYGFSVHFKLYPIIYAPALALFINYRYTGAKWRPWWQPAELFNRQRCLFAVVSAAAFILPTGFYYARYGWKFVWEAYLYHFARTDHRHNFSPYFYLLCLQPQHKRLIGLCAFLPQLVLLLRFTIYNHEDLPFCITAITVVFVTFNKVCTVQYFVWYFCLLPFVLPQSTMTPRHAWQLFLAWAAAQGLWLGLAFLLEMQGINTFLYLWVAGLIFFGVNIYNLRAVMAHHRHGPALQADGSLTQFVLEPTSAAAAPVDGGAQKQSAARQKARQGSRQQKQHRSPSGSPSATLSRVARRRRSSVVR